MIVQVADYLQRIGGTIDDEHWLRPIPGRPGYAAVCRKPKYTKKEKEAMRETDRAKRFGSLVAEARLIYNDPVQRAEWAQKHAAALREASRHPKMPDKDGRVAVPSRLWDYIQRELWKRYKE